MTKATNTPPQFPDYADILSFLANNPPAYEAERNVHASLLELVATSMRDAMAPQQSCEPVEQVQRSANGQ